MSAQIMKETTKHMKTYTQSFNTFSRSDQFMKSVQLIIGAVLAGYTAQSVPSKYMKWASHPIGQIFIYYLLFNQTHSSGVPRTWILLDAVIFTVMINLFIMFIKLHDMSNTIEIEKRQNKKEEMLENLKPSYQQFSKLLSV